MKAIIWHRCYSIEQLQRRWAGQRVIYNGHHRYYGWTGYECFGVIWPYRYYGWRVTCWAHVMATAFGSARHNIFFDQFDQAARVLDKLMDVAENMCVLSHKPVKYAGWKFFHGNRKRPIHTYIDFEWIHPDFNTNSRAPSSPASWRHFMVRHPDRDGRPFDPTLPERLGGKMWATYLVENHALPSMDDRAVAR